MSDPLTEEEKRYLTAAIVVTANAFSIEEGADTWHIAEAIARKIGTSQLYHQMAQAIFNTFSSQTAPDPNAEPTDSPPPNG